MNNLDLQQTKSKARIHFCPRKVGSGNAEEVKNLVIKVVSTTSVFHSPDPMAQSASAQIDDAKRKMQEEEWRKSESGRYKGLVVES